jgi:hypothetical protein
MLSECTQMPATTTTEAATTTTEAPTTRTEAPATTTEAPTPSSTVLDEVTIPSLPAGPGSSSTTTGPGIDLTEGTGPTTPGSTTGSGTPGTTTGELVRTGSDSGRLALIGVMTIAAGAALIVASRRRIAAS